MKPQRTQRNTLRTLKEYSIRAIIDKNLLSFRKSIFKGIPIAQLWVHLEAWYI